MLTITHTHEDGTVIEGTARGDGSGDVLKRTGWRWSRNLSAWYVPHSRDQRPKHHTIRRTVAELEAAGFEVTTELDETVRITADVEAAKIERQAARVDALTAKADRKASDAEAAEQRRQRDYDRLPEGGEPIKIGHHSEQRHRRAIDRSWSSLGKSVEADRAAVEAARKAETATHTTGARYNPVTVANRIEKLSAELRKLERDQVADVLTNTGTGRRRPTPAEAERREQIYAPRIAEKREQIAFWRAVREQQLTDGTATDYSRETVKKGDYVKVRGHWYEVARANVKTVSVISDYGYTRTTPWPEVKDHRSAEFAAEAKAKQEATATA